MHSVFVAAPFFGEQAQSSKRVAAMNWFLEKMGFWCRLVPPPFTGQMTNVEQRMNMFHLVSQVLCYGVPGDLVELGCYEGKSSVLIARVIEQIDPTRTFHLYDSFEGLPKQRPEDNCTRFQPGWFKTSKEAVIENFAKAGLRLPEIHVGWFEDTLPTALPERICFAYLDSDFYESILVSLEHVYPRMSKGAIGLIDDYCDPSVLAGWNELPGVKSACDRFFVGKPERVHVLYAGNKSHGYFRRN